MITYLSATAALPAAVAIGYGEAFWPFLVAGGLTGAVGFGLMQLGRRSPGPIGFREGYLVVSLTWLLAAVFAGLPYLFAGEPQLSRPVDAFFEGMSGFSTTGATRRRRRREPRPLAPALAPAQPVARGNGDHRARARRAPAAPDRRPADVRVRAARPRGRPARRADQGHRAQAVAPLHRADARAHHDPAPDRLRRASTTAWIRSRRSRTRSRRCRSGASRPRRGRSSSSRRITQWVVALFMAIAGLNFALLFRALVRRNPGALYRDEEARLYGALLLGGSVLVFFELLQADLFAGEEAVRQAVFQTTSLMTGTGFAITDYVDWPTLSVMAMIGLMFVGASAGSPTGSVKIVRHLLVGRLLRRELRQTIHPELVMPDPPERATGRRADAPRRARLRAPLHRHLHRRRRAPRDRRARLGRRDRDDRGDRGLGRDARERRARPRLRRARWGATSRSATSRSS